MSGDNFCFWLQGYLDFYDHDDDYVGFSAEQIDFIRGRLKLFFFYQENKKNDI